MFERYDSGSSDERIAGFDAQRKAACFESPHQIVGSRVYLDGHVDIRRQPRASPDDDRLGAEDVPGRAQASKRGGEICEELSGA